MVVRRIGGGIIASVSVAVALIVDKIELHLTNQQGVILLSACGFFLIVGLVMAFWREKKPASPPQAKPKSVTAHATGGGIIELDDGTSTADTFAHADKDSLVVARRYKHEPKREDDADKETGR